MPIKMSVSTRLLLTLVALPPRWILEAPANATLNALSRAYSSATLWQRYLLLHVLVLRLMVRRFVTQRDGAREPSVPAVVAFEIGNEPDYEWIPYEMRIERSYSPHANPVGKYVTELHLPQIPESDVGLRLWLSVIAYNLGNLWRRLASPKKIGNWSLTSLQQRLVKTGGRLVKHARYYWLLLA